MNIINCVIPEAEGQGEGATIELIVNNLNEVFMVYDEQTQTIKVDPEKILQEHVGVHTVSLKLFRAEDKAESETSLIVTVQEVVRVEQKKGESEIVVVKQVVKEDATGDV